jgi:hypothetical protein
MSPATAMNATGAAAHRWGWSVSRDRQRGQQRPSQREREQDNTGEHVFSARDEREGDQNHGKNQAGGHRASDDQPDPALLRPRRAFGLMVAVLRCHCRDHHGRPVSGERQPGMNLAGATETEPLVHKVLGTATLRRSQIPVPSVVYLCSRSRDGRAEGTKDLLSLVVTGRGSMSRIADRCADHHA